MASMPIFNSILCAVEPSPLAPRVIRHAAGLAGACGARLTIVTVTSGDGRRATTELEALVADVVPLGAAYLDPTVRTIHLAMGARPARRSWPRQCARRCWSRRVKSTW
jgi:K+-sensing histidine kinase KdpD